MTNSKVVLLASAKKKGSCMVVYCKKHVNLFKKSLAGTDLFVMENTASEGVIEWPAASDPVQGLHRIETVTTKPRLNWELREQEPLFLPSNW